MQADQRLQHPNTPLHIFDFVRDRQLCLDQFGLHLLELFDVLFGHGQFLGIFHGTVILHGQFPRREAAGHTSQRFLHHWQRGGRISIGDQHQAITQFCFRFGQSLFDSATVRRANFIEGAHGDL